MFDASIAPVQNSSQKLTQQGWSFCNVSQFAWGIHAQQRTFSNSSRETQVLLQDWTTFGAQCRVPVLDPGGNLPSLNQWNKATDCLCVNFAVSSEGYSHQDLGYQDPGAAGEEMISVPATQHLNTSKMHAWCNGLTSLTSKHEGLARTCSCRTCMLYAIGLFRGHLFQLFRVSDDRV